MKIIAMSDMHGDLPPVNEVPKCNVVCIAGDTIPLKIQRNLPQSQSWLRKTFFQWVEQLDCEKVILVAGNHDFYMDPLFNHDMEGVIPMIDLARECDKLIYLEDSGCNIDGVSFYGTPWITGLPGWAFYTQSDDIFMNQIPDCDVLITHAPPAGQVGTVLQRCWNYGHNYGSDELYNRLSDGGIKIVLSGHIHSGDHSGEKIYESTCYNVSLKDERYDITYPALQLDID